jgi:hypothetical protein
LRISALHGCSIALLRPLLRLFFPSADIRLPGSPSPLLTYLQNRIASATGPFNTGMSDWQASLSGNLAFLASPTARTGFFTGTGRVRIFDGDGTVDAADWVRVQS